MKRKAYAYICVIREGDDPDNPSFSLEKETGEGYEPEGSHLEGDKLLFVHSVELKDLLTAHNVIFALDDVLEEMTLCAYLEFLIGAGFDAGRRYQEELSRRKAAHPGKSDRDRQK